MLLRLQDRSNRAGGMTVNYLGHFEGREYFGCHAGNKMVYVDAFGNFSPLLFTPISFGNVAERPVEEIYREMRGCFPTQSRCFINTTYALMHRYYPENRTLHMVPITAKAASSILSFGAFAVRQPTLIYLVNGAVDGLIALAVFVLYWGVGRKERSNVPP